MRCVILAALLSLCSCTVTLRDERIDAAKLEQILEQHAKAIAGLSELVEVKKDK